MRVPHPIAINNLLMALLIIKLSHGFTCYYYWQGDTIPNANASSYCQGIITWPVSDVVLANQVALDAKALAFYQKIAAISDKTLDQDLICLGMVKFMACAAAYPTCNGSQASIQSVCSWVCQVMQYRCGTASQLYQQACVKMSMSSSTCSFGIHMDAILWILLAGIALITL